MIVYFLIILSFSPHVGDNIKKRHRPQVSAGRKAKHATGVPKTQAPAAAPAEAPPTEVPVTEAPTRAFLNSEIITPLSGGGVSNPGALPSSGPLLSCESLGPLPGKGRLLTKALPPVESQEPSSEDSSAPRRVAFRNLNFS